MENFAPMGSHVNLNENKNLKKTGICVFLLCVFLIYIKGPSALPRGSNHYKKLALGEFFLTAKARTE